MKTFKYISDFLQYSIQKIYLSFGPPMGLLTVLSINYETYLQNTFDIS